MPQRLLRPGLKDSPKWNAVDWLTQSLYVRLLNVVDDYGRYYANPQILRGHCFAMREDVTAQSIVSSCQQLLDKKLAIFYDVENERYLQLLKWQERVRSKSKFPDPPTEGLLSNVGNCQQMIASPPSPSSAPSPSPTPSVLTLSGLEVEPSKQPTTETDWLNLLQKSEGYRSLNVVEQYSRCGIWCESHGKQLTKRRFIAWLNKADKPMTTTVNGNGHSPNGAQLISWNQELGRVITKMDRIQGQYGDHQSWDQRDKARFAELAARKKELKNLIGAKE